MEVTVKIPDGEYCRGCKFLHYYTHELVNLFGDPTGNVRNGYECMYHNCELEVEDHGCYHNVKKCLACGGSPGEKAIWFLLGLTMLGGSKLREELEKYNADDGQRG